MTTLPLGAITLIGRKQPELRGIDGSVMCRSALKLADQATPSVALMAPLDWRSESVKSTMTSPSWMWGTACELVRMHPDSDAITHHRL